MPDSPTKPVWNAPPVFEAALRLNRMTLLLKQRDLQAKIDRLRKLLEAQMRRAALLTSNDPKAR